MATIPQTINKPNTKYIMGPAIKGKNFAGIDLDKQPATSIDLCQKMCLDNDKCLFVGYDTPKQLCYLKGANTLDGTTSGIQSIDTYDIFPSTDLLGRNLSGIAIQGDMDKCKQACTDDINCYAFSQTANSCYLKGFNEGMGSSADSTKSMDTDFTTSWKTIDKNSPILDNSIKNLVGCCMNYPDAKNCDANLPYSKQCDAFMTDTCKSYPYLDQCRCLNRDNNLQFKRVRSQIKQKIGTEMKDECWYPYCKTSSTSYVPTHMLPMSVTFFDNTNLTRLDNLKCAGSKSCNIKDIYNTDLSSDCVGVNVEGFSTDNNYQPSINLVDDLNPGYDLTEPSYLSADLDYMDGVPYGVNHPEYIKMGLPRLYGENDLGIGGFDGTDKIYQYTSVYTPHKKLTSNAQFIAPDQQPIQIPSKNMTRILPEPVPIPNQTIESFINQGTDIDYNVIFFVMALVLIFVVWKVMKY
jgi:hypothetical protein